MTAASSSGDLISRETDRGLKALFEVEPGTSVYERLVNRSAISAAHESQVVTETEVETHTRIIGWNKATLLDILEKVVHTDGVFVRSLNACGRCRRSIRAKSI